MGAGLAKMLQGQADDASFRDAFKRADKNKNGVLDATEIVAVIESALELLAKSRCALVKRFGGEVSFFFFCLQKR